MIAEDLLTVAQKEKVFRSQVIYSMHFYVGFDGKSCSRMDSDNLERTKQECAWVWGKREKRWMKKPRREKATHA